MIEGIQISGFKSLRNVDLKLGRFNLLIGANASGKSNFLEALIALQRIGLGATVPEALNGKPSSAAGDGWEPIRGGSAKAGFRSKGGNGGVSTEPIDFDVAVVADTERAVYRAQVYADVEKLGGEQVVGENGPLLSGNLPLMPYSVHAMLAKLTSGKTPIPGAVDGSTPGLDSLRTLEPYLSLAIQALTSQQHFDPDPSVLRRYGLPGPVKQMGEHGENFASIVRDIMDEPGGEGRAAAFQGWLRALSPAEVEEVKVLDGADGEPMFALREGTTNHTAAVLSDGTLRFAALVAAFFQPEMPQLITIEEIEKGLHPSRLRLLLELLKNNADRAQVIATTHSPLVLAWLDETDLETTFLFRRDEQTGESLVTPVSEIPRLVEIIQKRSLGELFAEGWLESAL